MIWIVTGEEGLVEVGGMVAAEVVFIVLVSVSFTLGFETLTDVDVAAVGFAMFWLLLNFTFFGISGFVVLAPSGAACLFRFAIS